MLERAGDSRRAFAASTNQRFPAFGICGAALPMDAGASTGFGGWVVLGQHKRTTWRPCGSAEVFVQLGTYDSGELSVLRSEGRCKVFERSTAVWTFGGSL